MSWPYSHTTRSDGTILTQTIYNGDHQNHIDNQIPTSNDGYEDSVAQMKEVVDPAPLGVVSLPSSLAGETTRLRYTLKDIKTQIAGAVQASQWYAKLTNINLKVAAARYEYQVAAQLASGDKIPFDTVAYNTTSNMIDTVNKAVIAPVDGFYRIGTQCFFGNPDFSTASPADFTLLLRLSTGITLAAGQEIWTATRYVNKGLVVETVAHLTAGQYVQSIVTISNNGVPDPGELPLAVGPSLLPAYYPSIWMSLIS